MSVPRIELDRVSKRYGSRPALSEVSFTISAGESVGYLGPNGAGKTTTLRLLAGLARPDAGSVRIDGADPRGRSTALGSVGVLVESPGLIPYLTGRDLLAYTAEAKGIPRAARTAALDDWSGRLGVSEVLDRPVGGLSTGQTRRLLLAAALLGDPSVVLLDEPTLGLDPAARLDLRRLLRSLRREGRTILLSTHLLEDVRDVCDRVLFLRDGELVGDQPVDLSPEDGHGGRLRGVRLRFLAPFDLAVVRGVLRPPEQLVADGSTTATVFLADDDARQQELIRAIVAAGAPLLSAAPAEPELARRYLEAVGRAEAT